MGREGPVEAWNKDHPEAMLLQGDFIMEVNGERDPEEVIRTLGAEGMLRMVCSRKLCHVDVHSALCGQLVGTVDLSDVISPKAADVRKSLIDLGIDGAHCATLLLGTQVLTDNKGLFCPAALP